MSSVRPPEWIFRLLRRICPTHLLEEIEGDLLELYEKESIDYGNRFATRKLLWRTIRFLRPGILLRYNPSIDMNRLPVLENYLLTSLRYIEKSKINFAFKLGGLTLSIFCFIIIAIYVSYQFSFDTFHEDYQRIYRVNGERFENGKVEQYGQVPMSLGPILKSQLPDIESVARFRFANSTYFKYNGVVTDCELLIEADTSLFSVFTFKFIKGDRKALKKRESIVLTRFVAERMFGTTNVLQKLITINNDPRLYEITAVVENMPANSSLFIGAIVPFKDAHYLTLASIISPVEFIDNTAATYLKFRGVIPTDFPARVELMLDHYIKRKERREAGFNLFFQPLKEIYMGPSYKAEASEKGNPVYVYAFSVLGILLLIVAAVNYINLSVADFAGRAREVGVRKVLGASKRQLIGHMTTETILYSIVASIISLAFIYILFPYIVEIIDSELKIDMLFKNNVPLIITVGVLTLAFVSTYIPAYLISRTDIGQNLKRVGLSYNSSLSRGLLLAQFSISVLCICCTLIVGRQVNFIHNKDLGFDRKNLIVLSLPEEFTVSKMVTLKQNLKQIAGITHVANSSFRIGTGYWKDWYFVEEKDQMKQVELYEVFSDDELFSTLKLDLIKGRTFDARMPSDSGAAFVINETAARELGWDNPLGKRIYTHPEDKGKWDGTIVGVVKDINISALYEKVKPLVMRLPWQNSYPDGFIYVRYEGNEKTIVEAITKKYGEVMQGYPLALRFVDELYNSRHQKETKAFNALQFGTLVIVLVSFLGIFSLATYISIRRMKEFGIRKVLGASQGQIAKLHMQYFVLIALVANCIALPLAYMVVQKWLTGFAYKIELTTSPFIMVGCILFLLVLLSGSYATIKAARMNPVDVIKNE